jgi:hypothetical protein
LARYESIDKDNKRLVRFYVHGEHTLGEQKQALLNYLFALKTLKREKPYPTVEEKVTLSTVQVITKKCQTIHHHYY